MKRLDISSAAIIPIMAAAFTSCIYTEPDDGFEDTLWTSEEPPFEELTIEFIDESRITATETGAESTVGTYQTSGQSVYFVGLRLIFRDKVITIEEAHRNGSTLLISWHEDYSSTSIATRLHRLR